MKSMLSSFLLLVCITKMTVIEACLVAKKPVSQSALDDESWHSILEKVRIFEEEKKRSNPVAQPVPQNRVLVSDFEPFFPALKRGETSASSSDLMAASKILQEKYCTRIDEWTAEIVRQLLTASNDTEITDTIEYARACLSYRPLSSEAIRIARQILVQSQASIEKALVKWSSAKQVKWPHQTLFQAFMGHMFLPKQFELCPSTKHLTWYEYIQDLISHAAFFKNPLAELYLVHILEKYNKEPDAIVVDYDEAEEIMEQYFDEETVDRIITYAEELPQTEEVLPYRYCALLSKAMSSLFSEKLTTCETVALDKGVEQADPWCLYDKIGPSHSKTQNKVLWEKLTKLDPSLAFFCARFCCDLDAQALIENNVNAGELGFARGYFVAGEVCTRMGNTADAIKYFTLAGLHHELTGFEKAAELFLKNGDPENALAAYEMQGTGGDPDGFINLGKYYLELFYRSNFQDKELLKEAHAWFGKAGFLGFSNCNSNFAVGGSAAIRKNKEAYGDKKLVMLVENSGLRLELPENGEI